MSEYNCPKCGSGRWTSDCKSRICMKCGNRYVPQLNQDKLFANVATGEGVKNG